MRVDTFTVTNSDMQAISVAATFHRLPGCTPRLVAIHVHENASLARKLAVDALPGGVHMEDPLEAYTADDDLRDMDRPRLIGVHMLLREMYAACERWSVPMDTYQHQYLLILGAWEFVVAELATALAAVNEGYL
jgi:hypothetical protein